MRSSRSNSVTSCPARASCCAAAMPAGPEPIDRDRLAGARLAAAPASTQLVVERAIGDRALDQLDGDRVVVDAEHARRFARRRTHAPGHLGEVVGRVQRARSPRSGWSL